MVKFLYALPMALVLAQGAWGACGDTTFTITGNPYNPAPIITHIQNCEDSSVVLTLKNGMGTGLDTVRLTTRILVSGRPTGNSVVTHLRGEGRTAGSPLILTENTGATDPLLIDFQTGNRGILSNINIVRKLPNHSGHSVAIAAKGTVIRDCHFYRTDNSSLLFGSLLFANADSVLVERNLFRAPPNGKGATIAIYAGSNASRNEYRSNIFYSTGLYLVGGNFHVFANTFAGSRDDFNAIIVSSSLTTSNTLDRAVNVQHNLFALKADTLSPIFFGSTVLTASDSIQKNAWSRSRTNLPLAVNGSGAALTLNNTVGGNINVVLPKGFSRYGPHAPQFKEYPLVTMRADETLPRGSADFGVIPRVFSNAVSGWTNIPDVGAGLPGNKLHFPNFTPFFSGKSWSSSAGIKVGALVDIEARITPPSPLDSGGVNRSFTVVRSARDSTQGKISLIDFDAAYYDTLIPPGDMWFFFHNIQGRLAANDSAGLKNPNTGTPYHLKKEWLGGFDSLLSIPKEVRTGNPIFVKMLHYNAGGQAPVQSSSGVIAQLLGIPAFPINDLGVPTVDPTSVPNNGSFVIKVQKQGGEDIDSIRVDVLRVGAGVEQSKSVAAPAAGASATVNFQLGKGSFQFTATPVAKVGSAFQTGPATPPSGIHISMQSAGDSVLVINRTDTAGCGNRSGDPRSDASAYCNFDDALADLAAKGGGTIVVKNGSPAVPFQGITIGDTGTSSIIITVPTVNGAFDPAHRAAFRGTASKEALIIARKNVTLRGFLIEMPAGSATPALSVQAAATGVNVDGCVFRPTTNAVAPGPAVHIATGGNGDMRFVSNLVWGFGSGIRINSTSTNVRILHNTFVEEQAHGPMTGILIPAATSGAVIANNYFSGLANPYDASVAGKGITLDHNGYPSRAPQLRGHFEEGTIDSIPRLVAMDLSLSTWRDVFRSAMEGVTNCDAIKECFELYAGSSAETYGRAITSDVLGRPRQGKPEVGAYEAEPTTTGVRGVLMMSVRPLAEGADGADDKLIYTVTPRTYDPADPESVYVWWSTRPSAGLTDSIPAANLKKFPIDALKSGAYTDTAKGLESARTYHIAAALGRNPSKSPGGRVLGYAYRDAASTGIAIDTNDCVLSDENPPMCPQQGYFVSPTGRSFQTRVDFHLQDTGVVEVPVFITPTNRLFAGGKIEISAVMPVIRLSIRASRLDQPGSKQAWKASIRMAEDPSGILAQSDLYILPADSGGLPAFVPTWSLRRDGQDWVIEIEGTEGGTFDYAFGKLIGDPGRVAVDGSAVPVFSYKTVEPGDSASVRLTFSGSGFATRNPLILVTPIPAGGIYSNPMAAAYPNRTLMLSSGLSGLEDSLRRDRFERYYESAVAVDSDAALSPAEPGTRKPFVLALPPQSVSLADKTILATPGLAVSGPGNLQEMTLSVPIWWAHAEAKNYTDYATGQMTRSIEVVFTVFDGSKITRSSGYVRTEFADELHYTEVREFPDKVWNLHAYPWDEADTGSLARIFERTDWNKDELRLMKYKGAGNGASAYTIFEGGDASGITYDAGQAVWTGVAEGYYQPRTSGGRSLDYQPFRMRLKAGEWNDIGLPFNFPMKWADVLKASNLNPATFKVWRYKPPEGGSPATWGNALGTGDMVHPWEGLTVRPAAGDTVLVFPVLDSSRSATVLAKRATEGRWSARIRAYNATAAMSLRIGKGTSESVTREAPDIPGQDFRVALRRAGRDEPENLSEYIQAGDDWRGHWSLAGRASAGGIRLAVEENRGKTPLYLVELLERKVVPLTSGSEASLSEEELKNGDYHLVAGDSRYLEEVLDGLVPMHMLDLGNYPNPFSHATLIRYALPESFGKVEFRLKVRDSRGRQVWEKTIRGSNTLRYQWDGRDSRGKAVGAGFYTLSLEAVAPGKAPQRAVRRMLKF